jgi:hypothetical protein
MVSNGKLQMNGTIDPAVSFYENGIPCAVILPTDEASAAHVILSRQRAEPGQETIKQYCQARVIEAFEAFVFSTVYGQGIVCLSGCLRRRNGGHDVDGFMVRNHWFHFLSAIQK